MTGKKLRSHVHMCIIDGQIILLDLKKDRYISLPADLTDAFCAAIHCTHMEEVPEEVGSALETLLDDMHAEDLLSIDSGAQETTLPYSIEPEDDLDGNYTLQRPSVALKQMLRFFTATVETWILLRWFGLERAVHITGRRTAFSRDHMSKTDIQNLYDLVEIFRMLRPFIFTAKDHCLFDSLSLLRFLSFNNIAVTWVFGVKTRPFAAHCWVQWDHFVCNDSVERVRNFHPIMTV